MSTNAAQQNLHISFDDTEIVIDVTPEERFDRLTRITKQSFSVPMAIICLLDNNHHLWLKSQQGLASQNNMIIEPQQHSLCTNTICANEDLIYIPDTVACRCFCDHPCVPDNEIRFYAGVPITLARHRVGTLCIMDYQPRNFSIEHLAVLRDLARCIEAEFKQIQQKQLIQLFRHQKKHLGAVLDTIVDGIVTINTQGIIESVNNATLTIFGYAFEEMIGNNINMLMPEPFYSEHNDYIKNYLQTGQAKIIGIGREVIGRRRNGETFPMSLAVGTMVCHDEMHFVGIIRDITEQKANQRELERFKYTIDHTIDCIFTCSTDDFRFLYVNDGAKKQVGYSEAELLNMSVLDIKPDFTREKYSKLIAPLLSSEKDSVTIETRHRHKDGYDITVEAKLQLIKQSDKKPRLLAIVQDISQRKAVENMKNQFVSTVSHELRTPLTSIRGALGLVLGGVLGEIPEKAHHILTMANRNSERLTLLINDLLDLEKIESAQMIFNFKTIDLVPIIKHALETHQPYADSYQVNLQFHEPSESAWVQGDEYRLLQVLVNLLSNACKFSHIGGIVDIALLSEADGYKVSVQDYGEGIPAEFRSQIFSRFGQANSADNRQKGGSGLGLSISKAIIERHQGSIGFDSIEGKGARFFFSLPAKKVAHNHTIARAIDCTGSYCPLPLANSGLQILHIEDDPDIIELVKNILHDVTVDYHGVNTLAAARQFLNSQAVDLVILDLELPDGSGTELLTELKEYCEVIVFSGHDTDLWLNQQVAATMLKSTTNNAQLLNTICRVLNNKTYF